MNKKKPLKRFKIVMIILVTILVTSFFLKDEFIKKINTTAGNNERKIVQAISNDTTKIQGKLEEKSCQSSLELKNKSEEKNFKIKTNEKRLGEKTRASINKWKNSIIKLSKKYPDKVILNGRGDKKIVALTFDDGPDRDITPKIIDELNKSNAKGTFFFQGDRIQHNEDVVKKAFQYGNQIAGHSFSHPMFTKKCKEEVEREMTKTNNLIFSCISKNPAFFRPPYGDINENTLKYFDDSSKAIIWSLDTFDWVQGTPAAEIARYVIDSIEPGDIVLMHSTNGKQETLKAVPLIIKGLKEKGYEFVTVSEMVGENPYKQ